LKVKGGDIITLRLPSGNRDYKVIGFVNTTMSDGSYGLISENYLKEDAKLTLYSNIFIKSSKNTDSLKQDILNKFSSQRPSLKTIKQAEQDDRDALGNTFTILNGISLLTLIIGTFGVFNNLIISFIERKTKKKSEHSPDIKII
jgi:putative ABC transport system permease protein